MIPGKRKTTGLRRTGAISRSTWSLSYRAQRHCHYRPCRAPVESKRDWLSEITAPKTKTKPVILGTFTCFRRCCRRIKILRLTGLLENTVHSRRNSNISLWDTLGGESRIQYLGALRRPLRGRIQYPTLALVGAKPAAARHFRHFIRRGGFSSLLTNENPESRISELCGDPLGGESSIFRPKTLIPSSKNQIFK